MNVDLDHARVRRDIENTHARVAGWRVAFDDERSSHGLGGVLDRRQQRDVILDALERRHEHMKVAVAHLEDQRCLDDFARLASSCASGPRLERGSSAQGRDRGKRIACKFELHLCRQEFRKRRQRKAQAQRGITFDRVEPLAAQRPRTRFPHRRAALFAGRRRRFQRKHEAGRPVEPGSQQARKARTLLGIR